MKTLLKAWKIEESARAGVGVPAIERRLRTGIYEQVIKLEVCGQRLQFVTSFDPAKVSSRVRGSKGRYGLSHVQLGHAEYVRRWRQMRKCL